MIYRLLSNSANIVLCMLCITNAYKATANPALLAPLFSNTTQEKQLSEYNENEDNWDDDWADGDWDEEAESPWQLTGFLEAAHGNFLQRNIVHSPYALSELRTRINLDYSHQLFEFTGKADSYYDNVLEKMIWHTRELNISKSPTDTIDLKIGRQILTWGTGDYLFLNDLFPKDYQSFFSGRADEYLKAPSDSVKIGWFSDVLNIELIWTPEFTPDHYINGERFSFYSPQAQQQVAPASAFSVDQTTQAQWSARLSKTISDIELSVYGYKGFWPTPEGVNDTNQGVFPKLNTWGASALTSLYGGIINFEYASYNSLDDNRGNIDSIANGQHRLLIGYEKELIKNLTASMQYYIEKTKHYRQLTDNASSPVYIHEYRKLLTLRLRYQAMQQTLTYSLFAFYSPSDEDAYLKPSIDYRYNDDWQFSVGANVFTGKNDFSFFGQFQDNSNAWARLRYQF